MDAARVLDRDVAEFRLRELKIRQPQRQPDTRLDAEARRRAGLTPETWDRISALRLPGIFSEPTSRRIYPAGDLAANVVGFVGSEGTGLGGVEYAFQDALAGTPGQVTYERGPGGRVIPTASNSLTEAQGGTSVRLTIDRDIQYVAQQALAQKVAQSRADSGTIVVMDPRTGHILARATAPTFDPNKVATATDANRGNRALANVFEPGSTSKLMTIAAVKMREDYDKARFLPNGGAGPSPDDLRKEEEAKNEAAAKAATDAEAAKAAEAEAAAKAAAAVASQGKATPLPCSAVALPRLALPAREPFIDLRYLVREGASAMGAGGGKR